MKLGALDLPRIAVGSPEALARFCKIDGKDGPEKLNLWPGQRLAIRFAMENRVGIILKARQLGITWAMALVALWFAMRHPAKTCLILSKGEREARVVLRRVRRLYASLPRSIREAFPVVVGEEGGERFEIAHPEGPGVVVSLPGSGGRSETAHLLLLDEGAHWEKSSERMAAVLPTAADAGSTLIFSTANGMGGVFWELWEGENRDQWPGIFLDALQRPDRDEAWVARQRASLGDLGPQEYPLSADEAFLATGRCAFDRGALQFLERHSATPAPWRGTLGRDAVGVHATEDERGHWWVWQWPEPGRDYIITADSSSGHGEDFSAAVILDMSSWDQVAALHGKLEPGELAREMQLAGLLWRGNAPALLVPELNNHGEAVVALLREWSYPRIYATEQLDHEGKPIGRTYGWRTNDQSRRLAVSALQRAVRDASLGIRDRAALVEMHRFVWAVINPTTGSGRYQADEGAHDDRVMSWGIAAAVAAFSDLASPPPPQTAPVPHVPRVSEVTGYAPWFMRGWWL